MTFTRLQKGVMMKNHKAINVYRSNKDDAAPSDPIISAPAPIATTLPTTGLPTTGNCTGLLPISNSCTSCNTSYNTMKDRWTALCTAQKDYIACLKSSCPNTPLPYP